MHNAGTHQARGARWFMSCMLELAQVCDCQLPLLVSVDPESTGKAVRAGCAGSAGPIQPRHWDARNAQHTHIPLPPPPFRTRSPPRSPTIHPLHPSSLGSSHQTPLNTNSSTHCSSQQHHRPPPTRHRQRRARPPHTHYRPPSRRLRTPSPSRTPRKARRVTLATSHASSGRDIATLNAFRSST